MDDKEGNFTSQINPARFVKFRQDPKLLAVDKLVRSHAESHIDKFNNVLDDPEAREQYSEFCRTRETDAPVIGEKIKELAEYWLMRRDLERYVYVWNEVLQTYNNDVTLFI